MNEVDETKVRRYLLDELSEDVRREFEEKLMTDDELFDEVMIAEEELAKEYACGELEGSERERFERVFLSTPQGREQVNFNLALNRYISETAAEESVPQTPPAIIPEPRRVTVATSWRQEMLPVAMALAAMVLLVAVSAWLVFRSSQLENQIDQLRSRQSEAQNQIEELQKENQDKDKENARLQEENKTKDENNMRLHEEVAILKRQPNRSSEASRVDSGDILIDKQNATIGNNFEATNLTSPILIPNDVRGDDSIPVVNVTSTAKTLKLPLKVPYTDYRGFLVEIARESGGAYSVPQNALRSRRSGGNTIVTATVPAEWLSPGAYTATLTPLSKDPNKSIRPHKYHFKVTMK